MSYEVLALKWRPKKFKDLIGQEHVTRSLLHSINQNQLGHSYLLTGTRGVGKTSLARIFSKAINCNNRDSSGEPCLACPSCLSIDEGSSLNYLEIDGASNNGVESVRQLVDSLQYLPTQGTYRVAVIDEVHMLSISAFNALLKTLEEPPKHVIFIFATTNPEKIPETVLSRCLRYDLKSMSKMTLNEIIARIAGAESIQFENDSVRDLIVKYAKGSVRDGLTLLEQLKNFAKDEMITADHVAESLGLARGSAIEKIVNSLLKHQTKELTETYQITLKENVELKALCEQILGKVFEYTQLALEKKPESFERLAKLYKDLSQDFSWMLSSLDPESLILMSLQKSSQEPVNQKKNSEFIKEPFKFEFENFLNFLKDEKPASAANLELGNILELNQDSSEFLLKIGFPEKSAIIYDFFKEKDVKASLYNLLVKYLQNNECQYDSIALDFVLFDQERNFKSVMDINIEAEEKEEEVIIKNFKNQEIVKYAEKIFGSEVTNVRLNKEY